MSSYYINLKLLFDKVNKINSTCTSLGSEYTEYKYLSERNSIVYLYIK